MANSLPRYVANPLLRFIDYLHESARLLRMSMQGIGMHIGLPNEITYLHGIDGKADTVEEAATRAEKYAAKLKAAESDAEFADKEIKNGFPLLHAHALVGLWGALESAVEDALVGTLMNESELLSSEAFSKLRVPLAEFETLERDERMRLLVQELRRSHALDQKQGIDGLERLLSHINLAGEVNPAIKKALWEMQNLRNVIVHRGSIADRRLIKHCPWLGLKVGDEVKVSHAAIRKYDAALHNYVFTLVHRLDSKYGVEIPEKLKHLPMVPDDSDPDS